MELIFSIEIKCLFLAELLNSFLSEINCKKDFIVSFVVNKRFGFFIINHLSVSLLSLNYYYYYYYCHYWFIVIFLLLFLVIIIR